MFSRTPRPGQTSSGRAGRKLPAIVALFVYLAGVAHLTVTPHVACAEHGGWVEATTSAPSASRTIVAISRLLAHEHCAAPGWSRAGGGDPPSIFVSRFASGVEPAELHPLPARDRRRVLLRLAPKSSPPSLRS